MTLRETLLDPTVRPEAVEALFRLAEAEVIAKKGMGGAVVKTAFAGAKKAGEGRLKGAINGLLPEIATILEPHHTAAAGQPFGPYLAHPARSDQVADQLLAVADAKAARVEGNPLGRVYSGLRKGAKGHVTAALPGLGETIDRLLA